MKKILLLSALLGFIAAPAFGQAALGTIGPGAVPCAFTDCKVKTLAIGGATIGTDALAVTGTTSLSSTLTVAGTLGITNAGTSTTLGSLGIGAVAASGGTVYLYRGNDNANIEMYAAGLFGWSSSSNPTVATDLMMTRAGAASLQFGNVDVDTGPVAQTMRTQGALAGGTSNVSGANWTFLASPGKGTGAGGSFIFQTTPAGSTGTVVGTPTTVMTMTGPGAITMPRVTTGTNADFLCLSAGAVVLLQTSACTISSARFKTEIKPYRLALSDAVYRMPVVTFRLKDGAKNKDPNAGVVQMGLIAENVAKIMPLCAIYENDMKTPKSYRQECLIAALVKTVQEQHAANDNLARRVAVLERRR